MKNFADSVTEPFHFPAVLDLYDHFAALHRVVTTDLPTEFDDAVAQVESHLKGAHAADHVGRTFFHRERLTELSNYVNALHHAHSYRVQQHAKEEAHDWGIDIRGGMIQLVHGMTAVSLCGAGLTKWGWRRGFGEPYFSTRECLKILKERSQHDDFVEQNRLGIVARLSLSHRPEFSRLEAISRAETRLGVAHFSVGHIVHALEYVVHLHEAAHLALRELDTTSWPLYSLWIPDRSRDEFIAFIQERMTYRMFTNNEALLKDASHYSVLYLAHLYLEDENSRKMRDELFANFLEHLFVFGDDWLTARRYLIWRFNVGGEADASDERTSRRLIEYVLRTFVVTSAVAAARNRFGKDICKWPLRHPWREQTDDGKDDSIAELSKKLWASFTSGDMKNTLATFYSRSDLFNYSDRRSMREWFHKRVAWMLPLFDDTWRRALSMYQSYVGDEKHRFPWRKNGTDLRGRIADALGKAIKIGETSILEILAAARVEPFATRKEVACEQLDPLCLVTQLLYRAITREMDVLAKSKQTHLTRSDRGEPDFLVHGTARARQKWGPTQIDVRHTRLFSCVPKEREDRLRMEIAVHRQLWDISIRLRTRRAVRLIEQARKALFSAETDKEK